MRSASLRLTSGCLVDISSSPEPFGFWETAVDSIELDDFFFVLFSCAAEFSLFERQRKLADKADSFDIAILLQFTRLVKNQ